MNRDVFLREGELSYNQLLFKTVLLESEGKGTQQKEVAMLQKLITLTLKFAKY